MKTLQRLQAYRVLMFTMIFSMVFSPFIQTFESKVEAAAPPTPPITYTVMAAGERSAITTLTGPNSTTNNNGSEWYYYDPTYGSIGFAPAGSSVVTNPFDNSNLTDPLRLS